ncbi:MAG: FecR domain-containing protein [Wujia sp.]
MEEKKKGFKKWIIIAAAVVLVLVVVVVAFVLKNKDESYRLIKVFKVDGKAIVTRESIGDLEAYENMVLESGDKVFLDNGTMTLKLDEDKYVYVEKDTIFSLIAKGNSDNSKTSIILEQGAITNDVQNKLSDESSYEINTPNSSMSVRGTVFRVYTYIGEDGIKYTEVDVFDGTVTTRLKYSDNTYADDEVPIVKGKQIIIYEDEDTTDYLTEVQDIDYSKLPEEVIKSLIEISENGTELSITTDELKTYLNAIPDTEPKTVSFIYDGKVFGTQVVEYGGCATVPTLMPAQSGGWDFDFTQPITEDTEIYWK